MSRVTVASLKAQLHEMKIRATAAEGLLNDIASYVGKDAVKTDAMRCEAVGASRYLSSAEALQRRIVIERYRP